MYSEESFTCTAFPFLIRHECQYYNCQEQRESLLVLRSPQRVPVEEFNISILDFEWPLDFRFAGGDFELRQRTEQLAAENNIRFESTQQDGEPDCLCPNMECSWPTFSTVLLRQLRDNFDSELVTPLPSFEFETTNDLMTRFEIRAHFIMQGADVSKEITNHVRNSMFDSREEGRFFAELNSLLSSEDFAVLTHISPKDVFGDFGISTVAQLEFPNLQSQLFNSIDHSFIDEFNEEKDLTRFWFNTSYDFVICSRTLDDMYPPLLLIEFDGYGGYIGHDRRYHLPSWSWSRNHRIRMRNMNQKIAWAQQFGIPLLVINPIHRLATITECDIFESESDLLSPIQNWTFAGLSVAQLVLEQSITMFPSSNQNESPEVARARNIQPYQRVNDAMEILQWTNDYSGQWSDADISEQHLSLDDALRTLGAFGEGVDIPVELINNLYQHNGYSAITAISTLTLQNGTTHVHPVDIAVLHHSEGIIDPSDFIRFVHLHSFSTNPNGILIWRQISDDVSQWEELVRDMSD